MIINNEDLIIVTQGDRSNHYVAKISVENAKEYLKLINIRTSEILQITIASRLAGEKG